MTASSPVAEGERAEEGNSFGLFVCCGEEEGHGVQKTQWWLRGSINLAGTSDSLLEVLVHHGGGLGPRGGYENSNKQKGLNDRL